MEYQSYLASIERHFQKSEYISIAKTGAKMFWEPIKMRGGKKLFCFVCVGAKISGDLMKKLAKYAESINFYDSKKKNEKLSVITLFVSKSLPDKVPSICEKGVRAGSVNIFPAAFSLETQSLYLANKFPLFFSGEFNEISDFAKKNLSFKGTEE